MTNISSVYSGYSNYSNSSSSSRKDMKAELSSLGIPDSVISQGPDAVKSYAEQNNITLPEPPAKPSDNNSAFSSSNSSTDNSPSAEFQQKLADLGIPSSVISEGREAVMEYAKENSITLPAPPTTGGSLNVLG